MKISELIEQLKFGDMDALKFILLALADDKNVTPEPTKKEESP